MNELLLIIAAVASTVMGLLWLDLAYDIIKIWRGRD